jgi:hypothetical protein
VEIADGKLPVSKRILPGDRDRSLAGLYLLNLDLVFRLLLCGWSPASAAPRSQLFGAVFPGRRSTAFLGDTARADQHGHRMDVAIIFWDPCHVETPLLARTGVPNANRTERLRLPP